MNTPLQPEVSRPLHVAAWRPPRVGLLALTLELYETLAPDLRRRREDWLRKQVLPRLDRLAEVSFTGAVFRKEDIEAMVADFEARQLDAIVVVLLTYSPSLNALDALQRTSLPILLWNTQELFAVEGDFDYPAMSDNHGVHGTQDLANVLVRSSVRFEYSTSHLRDEGAMERLGDFFVAAAACRRLRQARIGLLGYPFPGMGDIAVDSTHLAATLGCRTVPLAMEQLICQAENASPDKVQALVSEYSREYEVARDVREGDLQATARMEIAMRAIVEGDRLDAMSYQFLAMGEDPRTLTVPFVAASRLMAEGVGFGGEGDVVSAAGTCLLNWLNPPASFAEMFTIDFGGNAVLMSHMGEANVAMARRDRKVPLRVRTSPITRTRMGQLALATSFQPGPATLMSLTQGADGRWRLIACAMTISDFGPLEGLAVPHFKLSPARDVREFLTDYALAGGPHHLAVCFGDARRRIKLAASILGADYVEV
jgi:L-arabinose isomerase